jgi:hypothetical protein
MLDESNERWAELLLVTPAGDLLGVLPPLRLGLRWWPEVESLVGAVQLQHGLSVVILRLLSAERPEPHGGRVVYLAEVPVAEVDMARACCHPCSGSAAPLLADHPLRVSYARVGGPGRDLAWAEGVLAERGLALAGPARQIKTWNLSSLWCLPLEGGRAWLKVVPDFFAHEGAIIAAMPPGAPVPRLLGHEGARILMADIPGDDLFDTGLVQRRAMVELLLALQHAFVGRVDELLALGLPDRRAPALGAAIQAVLERHRTELAPGDARVLGTFAGSLERRFAALAACGLPDTLVHGDFHSGNVRGHGASLTLIDWGDSCVGHPLLDAPACLERVPEDQRARLEAHWVTLWNRAQPGCDAARAWALVAPLAAARQAVIYRKFLDHIEPAEHPYHQRDPLRWLVRTAARVRREGARAF